MQWLPNATTGTRVLDLAGGDGYWARPLVARRCHVVNLDISRHKLTRGATAVNAPTFVQGDALRLPFRDSAFDAIISVCALEHFPDVDRALHEVARVLQPGGQFVASVDALTRAAAYPELAAHHFDRYQVHQTFERADFEQKLARAGLRLVRATYLFRGVNEWLYLQTSGLRPDWAWNAMSPLAPVTALIDRLSSDHGGALLLVDARRDTLL
jgi:ubiquinone/menaquinone biosynthesis C-methylase UbiE